MRTFLRSYSSSVDNNSSDLPAIYNAIAEAKLEKSKPTIIRLRTTIGFGSKQQGTHGVHGSRKYISGTTTLFTEFMQR